MLSPGDTQLVARDRAIPGLATLLDPEGFAEAVRRHVPDIGTGTPTLSYLRYKPGMNCLAAYRFEGGAAPLDLYAKAHAHDGNVKLRKGARRELLGVVGAGRVLLAEHAIVVRIFPNDHALKALARLADVDARRRLFARVVPGHPDARNGALRTLCYKPERRYVGRLETDAGALVALKFYTNEAFPRAHASASAFVSRGTLRVARAVGASERRGVLALEWLAGCSLESVLRDRAEDQRIDATLEHVGAALAELHRQDPQEPQEPEEPRHAEEPQRPRGPQQPTLLPVRTLDAEVEALRALSAAVAALCPRLAQAAAALGRRLAAALAECAGAVRAVHGDFYAKQVLLAGDRVGILDLDEAAWGDPAADLGLFIAHLERDAIEGRRLPGGGVERAAAALLAGYEREAGYRFGRELAVRTAVGLMHLAPEPFRYHQPDWPERTEEILCWADAILRGIRVVGHASFPGREGRCSQRVADPQMGARARARDPAAMEEYLARALQPARVEAQLARLFAPIDGAGSCRVRLEAARVVRHKPGRRALIEYDLAAEGPGGAPEPMALLGKIRARGCDLRTYDLMRELRANGFGPTAADGIMVPEPMGAIPELAMWLQRKVPGVSATHLLAGPDGIGLARRIAEAIHKVHRVAVAPDRVHGVAEELDILRDRIGRVVESRPEWASRLTAVFDACCRLAAALPAPAPRGIHRDFYADQVIVDGERLVIVDFDLYAAGDPALDAGNFVAHLTEQGLRTYGDPLALEDRADAFVERFVELTGLAVRAAVRAYALLTLVRHIYLSTQFADRRHYTGALLELCEERLGIARPGACAERGYQHG